MNYCTIIVQLLYNYTYFLVLQRNRVIIATNTINFLSMINVIKDFNSDYPDCALTLRM